MKPVVNPKKSIDMFKISCNLGVFGYMFFLGSMYTYMYFSGEFLLAVGIYGFIGSTLLTIQYHLLRQLGLKERLLEILIVLVFQFYALFFIHEHMYIVTFLSVITVMTCVLINHKKVKKVYG
ncbi:hypothetical protein BK708_04280 [Bacillus thuringiensis serovar yunnanensis]|nr:hypothetical protein BK708_04280 [Bacillus thuringiensis serovar yunnanensis]